MAYKTLKYYSTTAASNGVVNGTNYFPEGQAPSTVNDAARQFMADLAAFYQSLYATFQARLTLTSGTPVTTGDVTGAGTLYLTPYKGNQIWLYDGSQWNLFNLTEISLSLSLSSGKPYDIWCYDNSGAPALEALVWTNDTSRATALATQNGILVKNGDATRRYVGTIYSSGANTTEDSFAKRYVWNYYNRVNRLMRVVESTNTWNYTTDTLRQANGSAANQLDYVQGISEDPVLAEVYAVSTNATATAAVAVGVGVDSTSSDSSQVKGTGTTVNQASAAIRSVATASYRGYPGVGRHFLAWLERSAASGTTTWYGDDGSIYVQTGIFGELLA